MTYVVPVHAVPTVAVAGTGDVFPVRRIYTVGRNYAAHARETGLGGALGSQPGMSLKPADSVVSGGGEVPYPPATAHLDPEVELVVAIGTGGADIPRGRALEHVFGYAVGFDMIRRDVLQDCIRNQHSWDLCKSFVGASPVGAIVPAVRIGHPAAGAIWITVNGETRQRGDLADQIWGPAEIIARLSAFDRLEPGDLIFTGTPKGPQPVVRGDALHGHIDGVGDLNVRIV
jgi:fumarylpyruvate hydrolase